MLKIFSTSIQTLNKNISTISFFRNFRFFSLVFFSLLVVISCGDTTAASGDDEDTGDGGSGETPAISCTDPLTPSDKATLSANIAALYAQCGGNNANYSIINVSSVTDMSELFKGNTDFNGDISMWNISNVTDMGSMFHGATAFNQDISSWEISSVEKVNSMFEGATAFDQDLSGWVLKAGAVVKDSAAATKMFYLSGMKPGNLPGNNFYQYTPTSKADLQTAITTEVGKQGDNADLSIIDTSGVTDMGEMFKDNTTFNGYISTWVMSGVATVTSMFEGASAFNQNLSGWVLKAGVIAKGSNSPTKMFYKSGMRPKRLPGENFYQYTPADKAALQVAINAEIAISVQGATADLSIIDTSQVTDMSGLFELKTTFNGYIATWDTSSVTDMKNMFNGANAFNQRIGDWDTRKVRFFSGMFINAFAFNQDLRSWSNASMDSVGAGLMFNGANAMEEKNKADWMP